MRPLLLSTACVFIFGEIISQGYHPFSNTHADWNMHYSDPWGDSGFYSYFFDQEDDVNINSIMYHKLCFNWSEEVLGTFREDENRRIYFIPSNSKYDNAEYPDQSGELLMYDFSKDQLGDTVHYPHFDAIVTEIDTVIVVESCRRRFLYEWEPNWDVCTPPGYFYAIEGIGGDMGFLTPYMCPFEQGIILSEYWDEEISIDLPFDQPVCSQIGILSEDPELKMIVHPNPCVEQLMIEFPYDNCSFSIFNSAGQFMDRITDCNSRITYNVSNYAAGVYYVESSSSGKTQRVRWLKI